jgi:hypothetical protein
MASKKHGLSGESNRARTIRQWVVEHQVVVKILGGVLVFFAVVAGAVELLRPRLSVTCDWEPTVQAYTSTPTTAFLLDRQVIVTGPSDQVKSVTDPGELGIELKPIRYCNVRYRNAWNAWGYQVASSAVSYRGARHLDSESAPFTLGELGDLTMRLYSIESGEPVTQVVEAINDADIDDHVYADPNYLTGLLGQSPCGSPHSIGGSPHSIGGSPFEVVGFPHSIGGSPIGLPEQAAAELFWDQWALESIGVGPSFEGMLDGAPANPAGAGVCVGVFDASPFTPTLANTTEDDVGALHFPKAIAYVTPTLELSVIHPPLHPLTPTNTAVITDVRDHGLFVAGLIHAIAPESKIHLIRVLDEYGCGELFTLNEALFRFIAQMEKDRRTLEGVVINLSLGVQKPRTDLQVTAQGDAQPHEPLYVEIDESLTVLVTDTIESLSTAVLLAHDRGAVVVAAAGNDSVEEKPSSPHFPAAFPSVIGVAANNIRRERACFSNWGDVSAPGGNGGLNEELSDELKDRMPESEFKKIDVGCLPTHAKCVGECDDAVISLMQFRHEGYAYWSGTSFAAPLASGLAALVLDAGASKTICPCLPQKWVPPDRVLEAIRCGTCTGDGVINVPATLFRCMP